MKEKNQEGARVRGGWNIVVRALILLLLIWGMLGLSPVTTVHAAGVTPVATSVYGQGGSFTTATANNGGISTTSLSAPRRVVTDSSGNLYVADTNNNRVLYYPAGSTTATRVYGQLGSFTSGTANNGGISATSLSTPKGLMLDSSGNLYISDSGNNRILFYLAGTTIATRVYGQGGIFLTNTANNGGITASSLSAPLGAALDSSGNFYIADTGNNRVLYYPSGTTTATRVYGQAGNFTTATANNGGISATSLSTPTSVIVDSSGNLYISDNLNNRELYYPAGTTTATRVYGQAGSFLTGTANNGGTSSSSLSTPYGTFLDVNNNLYIVDTGNNRVLFYPSNTTTATRVYVQGGSFATGTANNGGVTSSSLSSPVGVWSDTSGNIYVGDGGNNRVLKFQTSLIVTTQPPASTSVGTAFSTASSLVDLGSGGVFTDFTGTVSIAIQSGSGTAGAVLSGTTSLAAVNGIATFTGLSISKAGTGYILTSSSPGVGSANTNTFTILAPLLALLFTPLTTPAFTYTLTGATGTITSQQTFKVNDTSLLSTGWHTTITSTQFTSGSNTLPTTALTITSVTAACTAGQICILPTNSISGYPITVPAGTTPPTAASFYGTTAGSGTGDITVTANYSLSVPPGSAAGVYTSTATVALVKGQ